MQQSGQSPRINPPTPLYKRMDISHLARERQKRSQQAGFRVIGSAAKQPERSHGRLMLKDVEAAIAKFAASCRSGITLRRKPRKPGMASSHRASRAARVDRLPCQRQPTSAAIRGACAPQTEPAKQANRMKPPSPASPPPSSYLQSFAERARTITRKARRE